MRRSVLLVLTALLLSSGTAQAQDGALDMGMIGLDAAMSHVQQYEEARARRMDQGRAQGRTTSARPSQAIAQRLASQLRRGAAPSTAVASISVSVSAAYRPSPAVRRQVAAIMAEGAERRRPRAAAEMRDLVTSARAVSEFQRIAPSLGYRTNNAVDALAFYLLSQWGVANDHRAEISRAQAAGVRRQAAEAYASVASQVATDALRQEFAEVLIVQAVIMSGIHEAAVRSNDSAALAQYASMARQGGHDLFTMDPTRIALTDQGFQEK